jgi:hypothetical protein
MPPVDERMLWKLELAQFVADAGAGPAPMFSRGPDGETFVTWPAPEEHDGDLALAELVTLASVPVDHDIVDLEPAVRDQAFDAKVSRQLAADLELLAEERERSLAALRADVEVFVRTLVARRRKRAARAQAANRRKLEALIASGGCLRGRVRLRHT